MNIRSILPVLLLPALLLASSESLAQPTSAEARAIYKAALNDLNRGRTTAFKRKKEELADYVLLPYLIYHDMRRHISRYNLADLQAFEQRYPALPVTKFLRRSLLANLAKRRAPKRFLAAWPEEDGHLNADLRCFRAEALHATGQRSAAFDAAAELWMVGKSQSSRCDAIFALWRKSDHFTPEHVWRRLQLAIEAGQPKLARYLISLLKGVDNDQAEALYLAHTQPHRINEVSRFIDASARGRYTISHGLTRLARRSPDEALAAWRYYKKTYDFGAEEAAHIERQIYPALAKDGQFPAADFASLDAPLLTELSKAAVHAADWSQVERFVDALPEHEKHKPEWQYWLARALEANHGDSERARLAYLALAGNRQYYGFLAADRIGVEAKLTDASQPSDPSIVDSLSNVPGVARAIELIAVDDRINARREWRQLLGDASSKQEQRLLGYTALHLGELRLAISTANTADLNDEVSLRFPVKYIEQYRKAAKQTKLPVELLLAVTRQESAFDHTARSSANARGLMQLLPSTARVVAGRLRQSSPSTASLYQPAVNVKLGSSYLAWLAKRFNQQVPLMAAGYNAGEHRVDRWIKKAEGLDMDVWVERIPFHETRNYVKNVLAFKQVYSRILKTPTSPTLASHEQHVLPR